MPGSWRQVRCQRRRKAEKTGMSAMRFYLLGPRILGIRPGISFALNELLAPRSRVTRSPRPGGFIYVMKEAGSDRVKIGITRSPQTRLAQLQAGCPSRIDYAFVAPVSGDPRAIEKEAHRMLAGHRLGGEWFDCTPELAIAAVAGAAAKLGQSLMPAPPLSQIGAAHVVAIIFGFAIVEAIAATAGFPTVAIAIFATYLVIIFSISWTLWKAGR